MGLMNAPGARSPGDPATRRHAPDVLSRAFGWFVTCVIGVILGIQYWTPNKRVIPVVIALLVFGVAWRLNMVSALSVLVFLLPYPKGTVFGSTNFAFVLLVFLIWLLRLSLRMSPPARSSPIDLPIFLLVLWYILSFYNVPDAFALGQAFQHFALFLACLLLFYMLVNNVRTQQDLKRLHQAQLVTALLVFLVAALESHAAGKTIIPGVLDFHGTMGSDFNTRDVRVGASFRDYELLSEFCGITFLLTLFLWVRARSQTQRVVLSLFALFNVYTMFTTVTRGIIVSLGVVLPYMFYVIRRHLNPVKFVTAAATILVLAITMNWFVAQHTNAGDMFRRMAETKVVHGVVPEARAGPWFNAWNRALVHPFLGQGPYYRDLPGFDFVWPHNVYLYYANLIGFPGLLFFLALLFGLARILRPVVDDLRHASYADAYLIIARIQLFMFALNELKIDYLRNQIYVFQVWMWFGTWTAAYLVSRDDGVRAGKYVEQPQTPPERDLAA
jgi:O-antigen ligase